MKPEFTAEIEDILAKGRDMTIATVRPDGFPQATTVSYVSEGTSIYFWCDPDSQKAHNIKHSSKVSLTVDLNYSTWNEIRGVSAGAHAERLTDPEQMQRIGELMLKKFPQAADLVPEQPEALALFRVTPKVVSILNYSKGFGHTDLIEL